MGSVYGSDNLETPPRGKAPGTKLSSLNEPDARLQRFSVWLCANRKLQHCWCLQESLMTFKRYVLTFLLKIQVNTTTDDKFKQKRSLNCSQKTGYYPGFAYPNRWDMMYNVPLLELPMVIGLADNTLILGTCRSQNFVREMMASAAGL